MGYTLEHGAAARREMRVNMDSDDDQDDEVYADNETGYNGLDAPVQIETVNHTTGPAVILGAVQHDGHVIRAEGVGVLVIETAIPKDGKTHRA
jgi:hypothetical protein